MFELHPKQPPSSFQWAKDHGNTRVFNLMLAASILVPLFMTIAIQFPVSDFPQGPFNFCLGRFEVYFNPTHPGRDLMTRFLNSVSENKNLASTD